MSVRKITSNGKRQRQGRRIWGKMDGETVCAVLIRLWGHERKEWQDIVLFKS